MERLERLKKYKTVRNYVNNRLKKNTIELNGKKIDEAKNESQIWKIVKNINNPRKENEWKISKDEEIITDQKVIAEEFNKYFVDKISGLKRKHRSKQNKKFPSRETTRKNG